MRISIIVPVSLRTSIHPNLLTWIQNPLLEEHEVFLILDDDGSQNQNPDTLRLVNQILRLKPKNVIVCNTSFGTPGEVRNHGLSQVTGDWIFFWDADDDPDVAAAIDLVKEAHACNADLAIGLAVAKGSRKNYLIRNSWFGVFRWPGLWRFAFTVESVRNVRFKNWNWCEDQDFLVSAISKVSKVYRNHKVVYKYHLQSVDSLTTKTGNWIYLRQFLEELEVQAGSNSKSAIPAMFQLKTLLNLVSYMGVYKSLSNLIQILQSCWLLFHRELPMVIESTRLKEISQ